MKRIVMLTFLCIVLAGCKEEVKKVEAIRPVRVFEITAGDNHERRTFPGKVKAAQEASLAFRIPGQIVRLNVKEGDPVKKGQLIAQLDQRDHQAALADLKAKLVGAKSVLKEAQANIKRNKKLLNENIIAQSDYDTMESTFETSRAQVLSLQQSIRRAELNLQYTRLVAPFDGIVAVKHIDNHEFIQAKEPIVQLEDTSSLDVVVDIPENLWVKFFNSSAADIQKYTAKATFEALPRKTFILTPKEFQTKANPETQTYQVTMSLAHGKGMGVHPGMTAEIIGKMPTEEAATIQVPYTSIMGEPGGPQYVWVLKEDNTVQKRIVETNHNMGDMLTLTEGVVSGELIVAVGGDYLREGQRVKILKGRIGGRE